MLIIENIGVQKEDSRAWQSLETPRLRKKKEKKEEIQ